ncbi:Glutamate-tRNA ligase [Smittium culicis]|uniref:Glutamate-tRNA ligase n=1 Tax=Smittium culicis TaxID=133412 RepID=A0A1R1XDS8_9FUNG|nr:Glutamate-tRNA ligase [Smittium culicis]
MFLVRFRGACKVHSLNINYTNANVLKKDTIFTCKTQNLIFFKNLYSTKNVKIEDSGNEVRELRVRFAPSPTGKLHLGGLRTALYNYLFARKHKGKFVLRIEDTDRDGLAYKCYCSSSTLEEIRNKALKEGRIPVYDKRCSMLNKDKINSLENEGKPYTIRLKCPSDTNIVNDRVYGTIKMGAAQQDDAVLIKSDGTPTYHLAHPVDDHLMKITHVFRGEEWLPSTPKHLAIYRGLGWEPPIYVHLPLLFNTNKTKLSKRTGDVDVDSYRKKGYLPEAILNFVAFLGWTPKNNSKEILSLDELSEMEPPLSRPSL